MTKKPKSLARRAALETIREAEAHFNRAAEPKYVQLVGRASRKPANPLLEGFDDPNAPRVKYSSEASEQRAQVAALERTRARLGMLTDMGVALHELKMTERQREYVKAAMRECALIAQSRDKMRADK